MIPDSPPWHIINALEEVEVHHDHDESNFRCDSSNGGNCNCGADSKNEAIRNALEYLKKLGAE
jgi:hypothetical protein